MGNLVVITDRPPEVAHGCTYEFIPADPVVAQAEIRGRRLQRASSSAEGTWSSISICSSLYFSFSFLPTRFFFIIATPETAQSTPRHTEISILNSSLLPSAVTKSNTKKEIIGQVKSSVYEMKTSSIAQLGNFPSGSASFNKILLFRILYFN